MAFFLFESVKGSKIWVKKDYFSICGSVQVEQTPGTLLITVYNIIQRAGGRETKLVSNDLV